MKCVPLWVDRKNGWLKLQEHFPRNCKFHWVINAHCQLIMPKLSQPFHGIQIQSRSFSSFGFEIQIRHSNLGGLFVRLFWLSKNRKSAKNECRTAANWTTRQNAPKPGERHNLLNCNSGGRRLPVSLTRPYFARLWTATKSRLCTHKALSTRLG